MNSDSDSLPTTYVILQGTMFRISFDELEEVQEYMKDKDADAFEIYFASEDSFYKKINIKSTGGGYDFP